MPYKITGTDASGFSVVNQQTGQKKNKTPYKSKAEAMKYMRALYAAEDIKATPGKKKKPIDEEAGEPASNGPEEEMGEPGAGGPPGGLAALLGGGPGGPPGGMQMPPRKPMMPGGGGMPPMGM